MCAKNRAPPAFESRRGHDQSLAEISPSRSETEGTSTRAPGVRSTAVHGSVPESASRFCRFALCGSADLAPQPFAGRGFLGAGAGGGAGAGAAADNAASASREYSSAHPRARHNVTSSGESCRGRPCTASCWRYPGRPPTSTPTILCCVRSRKYSGGGDERVRDGVGGAKRSRFWWGTERKNLARGSHLGRPHQTPVLVRHLHAHRRLRRRRRRVRHGHRRHSTLACVVAFSASNVKTNLSSDVANLPTTSHERRETVVRHIARAVRLSAMAAAFSASPPVGLAARSSRRQGTHQHAVRCAPRARLQAEPERGLRLVRSRRFEET